MGPSWLPELLADKLVDGLNRVVSVDFREFSPDVNIDSFLTIPLLEVEEIWLDGTKVTDAGLLHLRLLTNLKSLHLRDAHVTDEGIAELQRALPGLMIEK